MDCTSLTGITKEASNTMGIALGTLTTICLILSGKRSLSVHRPFLALLTYFYKKRRFRHQICNNSDPINELGIRPHAYVLRVTAILVSKSFRSNRSWMTTFIWRLRRSQTVRKNSALSRILVCPMG
ncbi:hypothetical protein J6590_011085 [Homalodisca vitripennis]|nr:hypothetical protein J6590_011085 [Homalodisca vitripennis]